MLLLLASLTPFTAAVIIALIKNWRLSAIFATASLLISFLLLISASFTRPLEVYHFESALDLVIFEGNGFNLLFAAAASLVCAAQAATSPYFVVHAVRKSDPRTYYILYLFSAGALLATPLSGSLTTFFLFFETYLLSSWLMLILLGGRRAGRAANRYLMFTEAGALVTLLGLVLVYDELGTFRFDRIAAAALMPEKAALLSMLISFVSLVKMAIFPLHAWLPEVYSVAPVPLIGMTMIAEAVAGWAATRILLIWSHALHASGVNLPIIVLGVFTAVYGNLGALAQDDFRRLLAYASIGGGGLLLTAAACSRAGLAGVTLLSLEHAMAKNVLAIILGYLERELEVKSVAQVGGLAPLAPRTAISALIASLSLSGMPPTLGFWAETAVLASIAYTLGVSREGIALVIGVALAQVLGAAYSIWLFKRVFLGKLRVALREALCMPTLTVILLSTLLIMLGAYPAIILNLL